MQRFSFKSAAGKRLDKHLSDCLPSLARAQIQKLIAEGAVLIDGRRSKQSYILKECQNIEVTLLPPAPFEPAAQQIPLDIVYEDGDLLVINKRQGMVVHPAAGNFDKTLVNALLAHCGGELSKANGEMRPGIVHRLDKDTSGLIVIAKNDYTHISLAQQLKNRLILRKYIAIVHGGIKNDSGIIDKPIGRHPVQRKKMCVTAQNSKTAITHYKVLLRFAGFTFVECTLETGRTHQIRVHLASMGHPVLGDKLYGIKKEKLNLSGQMLHAKVLAFTHPKTAQYMEFESDVPGRFEKVLNLFSR